MTQAAPRPSRAGFTILESLTAIGIIVLIALLGVPLFRSRQQTAVLSTDARTLLGGLRLAQQKTVAEQTTYLIKLVTTAPQGWQLIRRSSGDTIIDAQPLTTGITYQDTGGFTNDEIVFTSTSAVVQAGTIILHNDADKTVQINVEPSGYVRTN